MGPRVAGNESDMERYAAALACARFHGNALSVRPLGGGFYGRVFLVRLSEAPGNIVVKLYLYAGLAAGEALQLETLARRATLRMPAVYGVELSADGRWDALFMEYIPGVNAGKIDRVPPEHRERLANEIIDNLIAWHETTNPAGFGSLNAGVYLSDWRDCYRPRAQAALLKAEALHRAGELDAASLSAMREGMARFDDVFAAQPDAARLIHGDYNTWNVLLTDDLSRVKAVIDPFDCGWADAEFDLYQLDNANGREYGLMELYGKKRGLSTDYPVKRAFYELFTELNHYADAGVPISRSGIPGQARVLRELLGH